MGGGTGTILHPRFPAERSLRGRRNSRSVKIKGRLVDPVCSRGGARSWRGVPARSRLRCGFLAGIRHRIAPSVRVFHQKLLASSRLSGRQLLHPQVDGAVSPLGVNKRRPASVHLAPADGHHEQHGQEHPPEGQQAQARDDALVQVGAQLGVVHLQPLHLASRHGVRVDFGLPGDGVRDDHQDDPAHQEDQGEDEAVVGGVVVGRVDLGEALAVLLSSSCLLLVVRPRRDLLMLLLTNVKMAKNKLQ